LREEVKKDYIKSVEDFKNVVFPEIKEFFGEDSRLDINEDLNTDIFSGIDARVYIPGKGYKTIAFRVQWVYKFYNTFTIRSKRPFGVESEDFKRIKAIKEGYEYPQFTIQGYLYKENNKFLNAAICKTEDLYEYREKYFDELEKKYVSKRGHAYFYVAKWNSMKKRGYNVWIKDSKNLSFSEEMEKKLFELGLRRV